jgi:hypothetical protein
VNGYRGGTTVSAGTLRVTSSIASSSGVSVTGGTFEAAGTQTVKMLAVATAGTAKVSAGVLTVGDNATAAPLDLGVAGAGGQLDVTTRGLVVDYVPGAGNDAAVAAVRAQVVAGYHGGAWDGRGILSSAAAANSGGTVGYALASEALGPSGGTFMGKSGVDASGVLVRYTLAGDANLDGAVDFNDLVRLAQNYNSDVSSRTASWWFNGDFDYDGAVGFQDLVLLAQNYNRALPGGALTGSMDADFAHDVSAAFASVPEPTMGVAAWLAAGRLLGRRRWRLRPR